MGKMYQSSDLIMKTFSGNKKYISPRFQLYARACVRIWTLRFCVVDSEIKIILVSGAKNMGSRKSETTLEQPSAMRSSDVNLQSTASWMYNITGCSD